MNIGFPGVMALNTVFDRNPIQQIGQLPISKGGALIPFSRQRLHGFLFRPTDRDDDVLILPRSARLPTDHARVLGVNGDIDRTASTLNLESAEWLRHPLIKSPASTEEYQTINRDVLKSWIGAFSYELENPQAGRIGLRNPQVGAIHAVHAHWTVSSSPATVVMPTGTGKTEVMLAVLISSLCPQLLVVVPTDALRTQIAAKFLSLGMLKADGSRVLSPISKFPIVCTLKHIPKSIDDVDTIFARSQIVVTTSSIAGQATQEVQERIAQRCHTLFIDEAHHAEAPTWSAFRDRFQKKRVLQFTATPFREDGKPLDGQIVFRYPLRKALDEGFFQPIRFDPVVEFNPHRSDEAIAMKAVARLRAERDLGHVLMARVESVGRAAEVFTIYNQFREFHPVQLHTGIASTRRREEIKQRVIRGESRIVICVDMLGEGFDLPELKIAAFHDIRKTLAVTLQLAGRFTRARPDLGHATFIANTAEVDVRDELRKLYTRDPDWNVLLPQLSDVMVGEQIALQEFLSGFTEFAEEIPLKTVRPATSAVVYRTKCEAWTPERFRDGIPALRNCAQVHHAINQAEHTLIIVTARRVPLDWSNVESLFSWLWELYVVVWSPAQQLLFINTSSNAGEYRKLAEVIGGNDVSIIRGQEIFRTFAGINRLRLQNVGLTEQLGRNVRYTSRMGSDVAPALPDVQRRRAVKSLLSGTGYEYGTNVTVGASRRGRIWSHRRTRVDQLVTWCKQIGDKLLDASLDPDEILKGTLEAETITERPARMPIAIDWPELMYMAPETAWSIEIHDEVLALTELSLELINPSLEGAIEFAVVSETEQATFRLELFEADGVPNYRFVPTDDVTATIRQGGDRAEATVIEDFFYEHPPVVWFADGSALEGNQYVVLKGDYPPYDANKIEAWDWTGVNLRKESQGPAKDADSIQARVIQQLKARDYEMIVNDDDKGEAADVVAIRIIGSVSKPVQIDVEFYHCKYSGASTPGQRIDDLYELCGQAQKSISWMVSPEKRTELFSHLLRREAIRLDKGGTSRLEVGDSELLQTIREMSHACPVTLKVVIVQPGISKGRVTVDQLRLMSVTENYLMETFQLGFGVIASA